MYPAEIEQFILLVSYPMDTQSDTHGNRMLVYSCIRDTIHLLCALQEVRVPWSQVQVSIQWGMKLIWPPKDQEGIGWEYVQALLFY